MCAARLLHVLRAATCALHIRCKSVTCTLPVHIYAARHKYAACMLHVHSVHACMLHVHCMSISGRGIAP